MNVLHIIIFVLFLHIFMIHVLNTCQISHRIPNLCGLKLPSHAMEIEVTCSLTQFYSTFIKTTD